MITGSFEPVKHFFRIACSISGNLHSAGLHAGFICLLSGDMVDVLLYYETVSLTQKKDAGTV
ncbi:hypothetical protein [Anseongella ginsenosidimutans]|uniref:hypothetical protein n=1 Tax=Anseongella ginsenosidimutans TaxID=496056 RepID=UPI0011CAE1E8|nr:hypothetical protein [Anseongella ginsenosidimutans]QEC53514.1 hypothetical protein FRZ59_15025 [Anseongella ginsenosidimutans]